MIKTIELKNFKSHLSTQLHLDDSRLHAIVGQNSSGKTSILQALYYLSQLADNSFQKIFRHEQDPKHLVTAGRDHFSVSVHGFWEQPDKPWRVRFEFSLSEKDFGKWHPTGEWEVDVEEGVSFESVDGWLASLKNGLVERAVYLKLISSCLTPAAYSDEVAPTVKHNGEGLAPALDYLRNERPERFEELQRLLKKVIPGIKEIGITRAKVEVSRSRSIEVDGKVFPYEHTEKMSGQEIVISMNNGERIPAHAISEGTMLTLGILAAIMHPKCPSLILLDDVEQGLHPKAQQELIGVFKEIIHLNPNLQILFSTHSPYIIDELTPSQVHVLNNTRSDGYTVARRLDEHPDVDWALQGLTTGEFWDAEGEEWILENNVQNG